PRTLPAAIAPVLVGTAAAERFIAWRFAAAFIVGLSIQIAVNYANDYFDGIKGVDTEHRVGPRRAVASGLVSPSRMKGAIATTLAVAAGAGTALAVATTPWLLAVGGLAFLAALGYSGGPKPYASVGLGEVFVFVFFGLVATTGSAFVQDERIGRVAVLAAIPMGLLATAILVANNLRDIDTDRAAGKVTLPSRLGHDKARSLYRALLLGAFPFVPLIAGATGSPWSMLPFLSLPLAIPLLNKVRAEGRDLIAVLIGTARVEMIFGVLLAVGLWIS
ncbi:MAG: 1,4-dihydroxy-2-naphthoate polyprenyltransferase, partial [Actinomycetota bacterium]